MSHATGDIAIHAIDLGKEYRLGTRGSGDHRMFRETLTSAIRGRDRQRPKNAERLWALAHATFDVHRGEAVGIVGRNGAGKSTLLRILARITKPSTGRAQIYGRLGSLLEVGTGFHPELTGRENVYLNGAILGMRRTEIGKRFDEIVDFAEIAKFIDTPVKRYSSGMYMRLAFAVAAHLDTEILLVDEVLAVGDVAFQQKCLGKMEDATEHGRTVLFVSHNMAAVAQLCSSAMMLHAGSIATIGPVNDIVGEYLAGALESTNVKFTANHRDQPHFVWAELRAEGSKTRQSYSVGDNVDVAFAVALGADRRRVKLAISIRAADGLPIATVVDDDSAFRLPDGITSSTVVVSFADLRLYPGTYRVSLWAMDRENTEVFDHQEDCLSFRIVDGGALTMRPLPRQNGLFFLTPMWTIVDD